MAPSYISTSALTARIVLHKQYTSSTFSSMATAMRKYSHAISKELSGYASIDASVAGLLTPLIYLAVQGECVKQSLAAEREMAVKATVYPVVFPAPAFSKDGDNDDVAVSLLQSLTAMETHTYQILEQAAAEPAANEIAIILSLDGLLAASKSRVRELRSLAGQVDSGEYWSRQGAWQCLQCGVQVKTEKAWTECPCCKAERAYAAFI